MACVLTINLRGFATWLFSHVDACTLRDYLAEYRALPLSQSGKLVWKRKITKMASL
jgi:hypothetical protein